MIERHTRTPIMHRIVEDERRAVLRRHRRGGQVGLHDAARPSRSFRAHRRAADARAAAARTKVLSATIFITDMGQKDGMNEAWTGWFAPEHLPSRATIGVADLGPKVLIEVVITAAR